MPSELAQHVSTDLTSAFVGQVATNSGDGPSNLPGALPILPVMLLTVNGAAESVLLRLKFITLHPCHAPAIATIASSSPLQPRLPAVKP
jgi:hypothetical protein